MRLHNSHISIYIKNAKYVIKMKCVVCNKKEINLIKTIQLA